MLALITGLVRWIRKRPSTEEAQVEVKEDVIEKSTRLQGGPVSTEGLTTANESYYERNNQDCRNIEDCWAGIETGSVEYTSLNGIAETGCMAADGEFGSVQSDPDLSDPEDEQSPG